MKNLKEKLTFWQLRNIYKKIDKNKIIDFKSELQKAKKILIIVPKGYRNFENFNSFLKQFKSLFPAIGVYYMISDEDKITSIDSSSSVFYYGKNDISFLDLFKKEFISKLQNENFQIIFDLNKDFRLLPNHILLSLEAPIKISFYNDNELNCSTLSFKVEDTNNEKEKYEVLLKYLKILSS